MHHNVYTAGNLSQTDTQGTHMYIDSTSSFILLPSLAEEDRGLLVVIYILIHMYNVDPSSSSAQ